MDFRLTKVIPSEGETFRAFTIDEVEPYRPLPAPVYIYLPKNEKYVSIKRPFDFFTESEYLKLRKTTLYYHSVVNSTDLYIDAAKRVRAALSFSKVGQASLEPSPFEISDSVLRIVGPLWRMLEKRTIAVESYYASVFTNQLCDPLPPERLMYSRDIDIDRYELGILRSGLAVFLAVHLSILDLNLLNGLRQRVFLETVKLHSIISKISYTPELEEINAWVHTFVFSPDIQTVEADHVRFSSQRVAQKLTSRFDRIQKTLYEPGEEFQKAADLLKLYGVIHG